MIGDLDIGKMGLCDSIGLNGLFLFRVQTQTSCKKVSKWED